MGRLQDKVVLVTGGGRGIGRAIAEKLTAECATVAAADLDGAAAERTADALDPAAIGIEVDVASLESVRAMVDRAREHYGRIDVLVNNAGWDKGELFLDSAPEDWDKAIGVNLYGVLHTCYTVLPVMVEQGYGAVVNLGSDAGRVGSSLEAVYSAAKGGIIAFTKTMAREMARHEINVNCVCPGPTDTALFDAVTGGNEKLREGLTKAIPFRRLAEPADLANAVAFLASDEAGYITGQTLSVSGGLTMS